MLLTGICFAAGCYQHLEVGVSWLNATTVKGTVTIQGEVRTFERTVGQGGCVTWDMDSCQGKILRHLGLPTTVATLAPARSSRPAMGLSRWTMTSQGSSIGPQGRGMSGSRRGPGIPGEESASPPSGPEE